MAFETQNKKLRPHQRVKVFDRQENKYRLAKIERFFDDGLVKIRWYEGGVAIVTKSKCNVINNKSIGVANGKSWN